MTAPPISEAQYESVYQSITEKIVIGRFQLDAEDRIVDVDDAWLALYGYAPDERELVVGHSIKERYVDDTELQFCKKIKKEPSETPVAHRCLLKKKTGEHFFAKVHTQGIWDEQGRYLGRFGYVRDVTAEEVYRRIDENLPVAFYIVRKVKGEDALVFCNREFLRMYDFDEMYEAMGLRIKDLYQNVEDYYDFMRKGKGPGKVAELRTKVKSSQGRLFAQEAHVYFDKTERYGVLRDTSKEDRLFETVANINLTIHTYHTTIHGLVLLTEVFIKYLINDPAVDVDDVFFQPTKNDLSKKIAVLLDSYAELVAQANERKAGDIMNPMNRSIDILAGRLYADFPWEALLDSKLDTVLGIVRHIDDKLFPTNLFNRELLRQTKEKAHDVGKAILLIMLYRTRRNLMELGGEIQQLLTYATDASKELREQEKRPFKLWLLVREVLNQEKAFATAAHIEFRYYVTDRDSLIWGQQAELASVISGLIHNAIKYSWQRHKSYVNIRLTRTSEEPPRLQLEITNYGVMIAKEEIASGDIFRYGYRGRYATDRHRPGSGIGLYYAKRVVEKHGGEITIASTPARTPSPSQRLRDTPHLTTVTVLLPIYHEQETTTP